MREAERNATQGSRGKRSKDVEDDTEGLREE